MVLTIYQEKEYSKRTGLREMMRIVQVKYSLLDTEVKLISKKLELFTSAVF